MVDESNWWNDCFTTQMLDDGWWIWLLDWWMDTIAELTAQLRSQTVWRRRRVRSWRRHRTWPSTTTPPSSRRPTAPRKSSRMYVVVQTVQFTDEWYSDNVWNYWLCWHCLKIHMLIINIALKVYFSPQICSSVQIWSHTVEMKNKKFKNSKNSQNKNCIW